MLITYDVNVGSGSANGEVDVPDDASEAEIALAILNDLYEYSYTVSQ